MGDRYLKNLSCWDQYLAMAFARLTYRESLRDIEACLRSVGSKLYHMGFRGKVARSTLADANESRDWRIFADLAQVLIAIARPLYARDLLGIDLEQSLYALDSTTIDLRLSLFPWAKFRNKKAAVKMHTLLDLHGNIPRLSASPAGPCTTIVTGGTGGIIVDNDSSNGQASSIYFSTQTTSTSQCGTTAAYCAVKLTQTGLQ